MKKWVENINEDGLCFGVSDVKLLETQTEQEVEQSYNGSWYLVGYAPEQPLEDLKAEKNLEIKNSMIDDKYNSGHFTSSLGFEIDSRVDDLTNVKNAIEIMQDESLTNKTFRDYNNEYHNLTLEQWFIIKKELQKRGEWLYQHKWDLEQDIKNAATPQDLEKIKW